VAQSDDVPGQEPVDPVFAALFRDEPAVAVSAMPAPDPVDELPDSPADPVTPPEEAASEPDEPAAPPQPVVAREPVADTGRLFRSQGVRDNQVAVLALSSDHGGRLRTLTRIDGEAPSEIVTDLAADPSALGEDADAMVPPADAPTSRARTARDEAHRARGLRAGAVYLLVIGVTVLVAFANALLAKGDIGWPTGLALVAVTVYCAWNVRRDDDLVAIITPPIAFFVAAVTAGQLFLGSAEGSLINRVVVAFFTLADNWYWIIGATLAALVIVIVRRRRA